MRNIKITNWIMILLFIGTTLSIFHLRNHRWNYANLLGNNRSSVQRAAKSALSSFFGSQIDLSSVEMLLTPNEINNEFKNYLQTISDKDLKVNLNGLKFFAVDGIKVRNMHPYEHKTYISPYSEDVKVKKPMGKLKNIANIGFRNRFFKVQLEKLPLFYNSYFSIVIFSLIILFVLLILALNSSPQYQIYLKSMYLIYFFKIAFFFTSLLSEHTSLFGLLSQFSDLIFNVIFILAFYKILAKYHILVPRLLMLALFMNLWFHIKIF
jgi:hypothetical protein